MTSEVFFVYVRETCSKKAVSENDKKNVPDDR